MNALLSKYRRRIKWRGKWNKVLCDFSSNCDWISLSHTHSLFHTCKKKTIIFGHRIHTMLSSKLTWAFSNRSLRGRSYNLTLVSNICKTAPVDLRSGPPTDSTNYHKYILNFPSPWLANWQWLFEQANYGAHSNPGTQVGTQNSGRSRPTDKGGGGYRGGHPVPEISGGGAGLKKFFRPLRPQLGAGEGAGTPGPSPGSATADQGFWRCFVDTINKSWVPSVVQAIF